MAGREEVDTDTLEWAKKLLEDGMPYRIAAETVGVHRETLANYLPGYADDEWQEVWASILSTPQLLRWHWMLHEYDPQHKEAA